MTFCSTIASVSAQTFESSLQLRPRFEFRNGYKTLLSEGQEPASFVSQRTRLNIGYQHEKLLLKISAQNIGVWGDTPTMTLGDNNGIALFEAYGQYHTSENLMFRLGRQVLSYDNQRILGEVNWAQQAQSHDAALLSWLPKTNHRLDVVVAYNAESEALIELPYNVNSYKNMQFAWYHMDVNKVEFSFLLMNTGYEFENAMQEREVDYLQTYGAFHKFASGDFTGNIAFYGQTGSRTNRDVDAWYGGINLNYSLTKSWTTSLGAEYFSGTDMNTGSNEISSFTPLFGTNHGFNGHMDYFFVGNHQNSVGLLDISGKIAYTAGKFGFSIMPHVFSSTAEIRDFNNESQSNYLGTEVDLAGTYKVQKDISVAAGYSQMFGSSSLEILKGGDAGITQNWAWVMVNINPRLFSFTKE